MNINAFPISVFMMLRAPLFASPGRPEGWLQPYTMAGLSLYTVDINHVEHKGKEVGGFLDRAMPTLRQALK